MLGVRNRFLFEIEIKRSLSDLKQDAKKQSRVIRNLLQPFPNSNCKYPKQFWYLVPAELQARVEPLVPPWAGLIIGPTKTNYCLTVVKKAPVNSESTRLSVKECVRMVRMVANWAMTEAENHHSAWSKFHEGHWPWPEPEYEI